MYPSKDNPVLRAVQENRIGYDTTPSITLGPLGPHERDNFLRDLGVGVGIAFFSQVVIEFTQDIAHRLRKDGKTSRHALAISCVLSEVIRYATMRDGLGYCCAKAKTIGQNLNLSEHTVLQHLKWLEDKEYILKIGRGPTGSIHYIPREEKLKMAIDNSIRRS